MKKAFNYYAEGFSTMDSLYVSGEGETVEECHTNAVEKVEKEYQGNHWVTHKDGKPQFTVFKKAEPDVMLKACYI